MRFRSVLCRLKIVITCPVLLYSARDSLTLPFSVWNGDDLRASEKLPGTSTSTLQSYLEGLSGSSKFEPLVPTGPDPRALREDGGAQTELMLIIMDMTYKATKHMPKSP